MTLHSYQILWLEDLDLFLARSGPFPRPNDNSVTRAFSPSFQHLLACAAIYIMLPV